MKIALIHYTFPPTPGGVERVLADHAAILLTHGHEVIAISRTPHPSLDPRVVCHTFPEHVAKPGGLLSTKSNSFAASLSGDESGNTTADFERDCELNVLFLKKVLTGCDAAMVHNMLTMPFDIAATHALLRLSISNPEIRWINWIHDVAAANPYYKIPHVPPWDALRVACNAFIHTAISEQRRREFCAITSCAEDAVRVLPNGIDPGEFLRIPKALRQFCDRTNLFNRDVVLFHPTRLLPRKNVELGIRTVAILRDRGTDACLLISGAPDAHNRGSVGYATELENLVTDLSLDDRVLLVGSHLRVDDDAVRSLYHLADILWYPSHQEGFGLPMLESALARIPALAMPLPALTAHGLTNVRWLDPQVGPEAAADAILQIMRHDPAFADRKHVVRTFGMEVIYQKYFQPLLNL